MLQVQPGKKLAVSIVDGERDARQLAKLRNPRCHKSEEEIAEQLSGHWREDHLFSLRQGLKMYDASVRSAGAKKCRSRRSPRKGERSRAKEQSRCARLCTG